MQTDVIKQNVLHLDVAGLGLLQSTLLPNAYAYPISFFTFRNSV